MKWQQWVLCVMIVAAMMADAYFVREGKKEADPFGVLANIGMLALVVSI